MHAVSNFGVLEILSFWADEEKKMTKIESDSMTEV